MSGSWIALPAAPFKPDTMLLLTDGSVLCLGAQSRNWWRLRPDEQGQYGGAAWEAAAPMWVDRQFFASAVLANGCVIVAGGEFGEGRYGEDEAPELPTAELFVPWQRDNPWMQLPDPGWQRIGDAPCCVLADGRFLLGSIDDGAVAIYDPATGRWTVPPVTRPAGPTAAASSTEETWTLLPDKSVLTVDCSTPGRSLRFVPGGAGRWEDAGTLPLLVDQASKEIGPAVLMNDGRVFAIGATGRTALYQPSAATPWSPGPTFPEHPDYQGKGPMQAKDAPASILPSGNVLCVVGPPASTSPNATPAEQYPGPLNFFEFDGATLTPVPSPIANRAVAPYQVRLLLLPTGEVLMGAGTPEMYLYRSTGAPPEAARPRITTVDAVIEQSGYHKISGFGFNGLTQAVSYGDDAAMATNYPLVKITSGGQVWFCTTYGHSTMGVATGATPVSTNFLVPSDVPLGRAQLCVVANGVPSAPVDVEVRAATPPAASPPAANSSAARPTPGPARRAAPLAGAPIAERLALPAPAEGGAGPIPAPTIGDSSTGWALMALGLVLFAVSGTSLRIPERPGDGWFSIPADSSIVYVGTPIDATGLDLADVEPPEGATVVRDVAGGHLRSYTIVGPAERDVRLCPKAVGQSACDKDHPIVHRTIARGRALWPLCAALLLLYSLPLLLLGATPRRSRPGAIDSADRSAWIYLLSERGGGLSLGRVQFVIWFGLGFVMEAVLSIPVRALAPVNDTMVLLLGLGGATAILGAAATPKAGAATNASTTATLSDLVEDWSQNGDLSRYQVMVLTLFVAAGALLAFFNTLSTPTIPAPLLGLISASQATYLGTKAVKTTRMNAATAAAGGTAAH